MKIHIDEKHHAGAAKLLLSPKESFHVRRQGVIAKSNNGLIDIDTAHNGMCKITNGDSANEFWLAGQSTGEVLVVDVQKHAVLAHEGVVLGAQTGLSITPASSSLPVPGQQWLKIDGDGSLLLSALGMIYTLQVDSEYIVNAAYIIAYSEALKYEPVAVDPKQSGKGLASANYKFLGKGFIWCQTHRPDVLGSLLSPQLNKLKS